jgi:hypothetical protein
VKGYVMLTQERLKEVLRYDPVAGMWTWLVDKSQRTKVGMRAGGFDKGYLRISVDGERFKSCRLAFLYVNGKFPDGEVDHINRDKSDDRWTNLRVVTKAQNGHNRKAPSTNTSGHRGVHFQKTTQKWIAYLTVNGKRIHLGSFVFYQKAVATRLEAEKTYFGEHRCI